jgi:hypothetical protein
MAPGTVRIDSIARIADAAKQAQAEYVSGAFAKLVRGALEWLVPSRLRGSSRERC